MHKDGSPRLGQLETGLLLIGVYHEGSTMQRTIEVLMEMSFAVAEHISNYRTFLVSPF